MTPEAYSAERQIKEWYWRLEEKPSFVYVIQGDPGTPIKVGVAKDPLARLRGLQTGNPQKLRILCITPGDHVLEASFHHRLRKSRVLGEWFGAPGIDEFLIWVAEYAEQAVRSVEQTGQLPAVPPIRKIKRRGFGPDRAYGPQVGHRWRTSTGEEQRPMTIRYIKPEPLTADELAERKQKRESEQETNRKLYRTVDPDEWYPGKEDAA